MFRAGVDINTTNISDDLKKDFGFGPGDRRWFGVVSWDDPDGEEVHGELKLISKRTLPTHKVIVDRTSQQMTLLDHPSLGPIPYSVRALLVSQPSASSPGRHHLH